jgi:hypothetical protein
VIQTSARSSISISTGSGDNPACGDEEIRYDWDSNPESSDPGPNVLTTRPRISTGSGTNPACGDEEIRYDWDANPESSDPGLNILTTRPWISTGSGANPACGDEEIRYDWDSNPESSDPGPNVLTIRPRISTGVHQRISLFLCLDLFQINHITTTSPSFMEHKVIITPQELISSAHFLEFAYM